MENKIVVITGATGFVGQRLCLALFKKGYHLRILCRSVKEAKLVIPLPAEFIRWDAESVVDEKILEGTDAILHLAGAPIAEGRWTQERKVQILNSRTRSTEHLVAAAKRCKTPPKVFVGASAIGIYGSRADETLMEDAASGNGFLADVCRLWEASLDRFPGRKVMLRTGVVLGYGGALKKMLLPFRLGGGGRLGDGQQWMSWIHIDDLVRLYIFSIEENFVQGPVNAVAPGAVTNRDFTKAMAKSLGVPAVLPVPNFMLKLVFGEMASVLLDSQHVVPREALKAGFTFSYPDINAALHALLRPRGLKGTHVFESYQWFPHSQTEIFDFFSRAENLEKITPPWLNFRILKKSSRDIQQGTLIDYRLKIKGVPAKWRTSISNWTPPNQFMDSQLRGPYSLWEHTHRFEEINGGTLMMDEVVYRVPMGPIGHVVNEVIIRSDIEGIFNYRTARMAEHFSK